MKSPKENFRRKLIYNAVHGTDAVGMVIDGAFIVFGIAVIGRATPLSIRYNTWTTQFRERHPDFNPPPTPEWRRRNTRIMVVVIRAMGLMIVVLSLLTLIGAINSR